MISPAGLTPDQSTRISIGAMNSVNINTYSAMKITTLLKMWEDKKVTRWPQTWKSWLPAGCKDKTLLPSQIDFSLLMKKAGLCQLIKLLKEPWEKCWLISLMTRLIDSTIKREMKLPSIEIILLAEVKESTAMNNLQRWSRAKKLQRLVIMLTWSMLKPRET